MSTTFGKLDIPDIVVVVIYFAIVMAVGIWSSCRNRGSVSGYFLASRTMHWIPVGASLFASNIGSGHFIGLAGTGAASGIGTAVFELNAIFVLMILGWVFLPVYTAAGVFTMPEYLRKRFGGQRIRVYLASLSLLLYIFTKISADLYSGAVFIEQSLGISLFAAVPILLAISALFTILGGLTAVIWTDFIQTVIMLIGATYLMIMSFEKVGGYDNLVARYFNSIPNTTRSFSSSTGPPDGAVGNTNSSCGLPAKNAMHLFRSYDDGDFPWPGVIIGLTISSVWYWCSDQVIVQRALAAKTLTHAKAGTVLAGWIKILPMWLIVFPGMVARILYTDDVACSDPVVCNKICSKSSGCTDIAYPRLVLDLMPSGAKGLMLAVMLASLVSSLTSIFNSSSTIFTMDIYKLIRPRAGDAQLMIVGRVSVVVLVGIGVLWIKIVQSTKQLFHYIQSVTSYLSPPVCAVYVLAILWERCTEKGAFSALMVGLVIGLIRLIADAVYGPIECWQKSMDSRPAILTDVHYLHFGIILFIICCSVAVAVSYLTEPLPKKYSHRLLFWNTDAPEEDSGLHNNRTGGDDARGSSSTAGKLVKTGVENPVFASAEEIGVQSMAIAADKSNEPRPRLPWYWRAVHWICGIENMQQQLASPEQTQQAAEAALLTTVPEPYAWRILVNCSAVLLTTVVVFIWGFFA